MYSLLRNAPLRKHLAAEARTLLVSQSLTLLPALVITQLFSLEELPSGIRRFPGNLVRHRCRGDDTARAVGETGEGLGHQLASVAHDDITKTEGGLHIGRATRTFEVPS